jgi:PAS domain S-box-containing protein
MGNALRSSSITRASPPSRSPALAAPSLPSGFLSGRIAILTDFSAAGRVARRNGRWMAILLTILIADVVGILFTLAAERRINASFESAVTDNLESNSRGSAIHELSSLAAEVSTFDDASQQVRAEAIATFAAKLEELRSRTRENSGAAESDLSAQVDLVASQMKGVSEEAQWIASFSKERKLGEAETHWRELLRRRNGVEAALKALDEAMQHEELRILLQMADAVPSLGRLQKIYAILIVILLLVIGAGFYRVAMQLMSSRHRDLSEERLKLATNATTDVIWDWSVGEDRAWCNERYSELTGQRLSKSGTIAIAEWLSAIHSEDLAHVRQSLAAALKSRTDLWSDEYRQACADGTYRFVLARGQIIRDANGMAVRLVGAISDMTQHRLAEKQMAELSRQNEMILNTAGDGIFGVDLEGKATFVNPAARRMTGFSLEEFGAQTVHATLHRNGADGLPFVGPCTSCDAVRDGIVVPASEDVFWRADGTPLQVESTITPMRDDSGQTIGAVVTFRDDSQRRAIERMKDEFISVVSHELRTPLTSIRGALGLLANGLADRSSAKGQRMLEIAVSNTERLIRLINDILDIERIDSGKVTLVRTSVATAEVLRIVADLMWPLAEKAEVRLDIDAESTAEIWADCDQVVQTLSNLVNNAIKFSPAGTTVAVTAEESANEVTFRIRDHGRGIPKENIDSIFERFQQVNASDSRDKGGSGLGLTICRSIVRQHGGQIGVESVLGEGSTFHFTIPTSRLVVATPSNFASAPPRVLVCDDEEPGREAMRVILERHGYSVVAVASGTELIEALPSSKPDVILLDLFMPDMSGWETLALLKSDPSTATIPVVISHAREGDQQKGSFDIAGWVTQESDAIGLMASIEGALGSGGRQALILVVEDDLDLARVICESFERHGIKTAHAANGHDAIALSNQMTPDLVILDVGLPDLDGFAVVHSLRGKNRLRNVPLVIYSANDPTPPERERLRLGPTEFMIKSRVRPEEFERRVVELLNAIHESDAA